MDRVEQARRYPHRTPNPDGWHLLGDGRLRPTGTWVSVAPDPRADQWRSGLFIPGTADDDARAQTGTVTAVGPDRTDLEPGDRVLYRRWGGTEVQLGATDLLLLAPRDVFAVLEES